MLDEFYILAETRANTCIYVLHMHIVMPGGHVWGVFWLERKFLFHMKENYFRLCTGSNAVEASVLVGLLYIGPFFMKKLHVK